MVICIFLVSIGMAVATTGGMEAFMKKPVYVGPAPEKIPEGGLFVIIALACFSLATLTSAALINHIREDSADSKYQQAPI